MRRSQDALNSTRSDSTLRQLRRSSRFVSRIAVMTGFEAFLSNRSPSSCGFHRSRIRRRVCAVQYLRKISGPSSPRPRVAPPAAANAERFNRGRPASGKARAAGGADFHSTRQRLEHAIGAFHVELNVDPGPNFVRQIVELPSHRDRHQQGLSLLAAAWVTMIAEAPTTRAQPPTKFTLFWRHRLPRFMVADRMTFRYFACTDLNYSVGLASGFLWCLAQFPRKRTHCVTRP